MLWYLVQTALRAEPPSTRSVTVAARSLLGMQPESFPLADPAPSRGPAAEGTVQLDEAQALLHSSLVLAQQETVTVTLRGSTGNVAW